MIKGFTASAFDLLHPGHVAMLEEARKQCDYLIVALHTDPSYERPAKSKPVETTFERFMRLKACRFVDEIIPYDTEKDLYNLLTIIKPDVRFVGEEYSSKTFTGSQLPVKIFYTPRNHNFSSSELRKRIKNA